MKLLFSIVAALMLVITTPALAEKPSWAGKGKPDREEIEAHVDKMKNKHKDKKEKKANKEKKGKKHKNKNERDSGADDHDDDRDDDDRDDDQVDGEGGDDNVPGSGAMNEPVSAGGPPQPGITSGSVDRTGQDADAGAQQEPVSTADTNGHRGDMKTRNSDRERSGKRGVAR